MKLLSLIAFAVAATTPVFAEKTRQLDAHEHGVGQLDIALSVVRVFGTNCGLN